MNIYVPLRIKIGIIEVTKYLVRLDCGKKLITTKMEELQNSPSNRAFLL